MLYPAHLINIIMFPIFVMMKIALKNVSMRLTSLKIYTHLYQLLVTLLLFEVLQHGVKA